MLPIPELRAFAADRHGLQLYGGKPYVVHLDAVFDIARRYNLGTAYERAAFGHDLLDDTDTKQADLEGTFGVPETALIYSVSGSGSNRAARRQNTIARLWCHLPGVNLKLPDRYANVENSVKTNNIAMLKMYLMEAPLYAPLFKQGNALLYADLRILYEAAEQLIATARHP